MLVLLLRPTAYIVATCYEGNHICSAIRMIGIQEMQAITPFC
jgi:hypothetical protein